MKNHTNTYFLIFSIIMLLLINTIMPSMANTLINEKEKVLVGDPIRSLYTYHTNYPESTGDYNALVSDMQNLNSLYPDIFELFNAQDAYGLPDVIDGSNHYKTWIIRITNENTGFNKPEVLLIGTHHGNEKVSTEAAYYFAELLVQNYATDSYIKNLVDTREIYIMPLANPYGWAHHIRNDEHGYDMNRDYPYDASSHVFGTIGARAVHELTKRHLFINTVSWHGGSELICYAWGSYAHYGGSGSPIHESPDDIAFYNQGQYYSEYARPYSGYYTWLRANDWYPVYGAYEDYAYAGSWDLAYMDPSWPTNGCRSLTHCVEMSSTKYPPESTLGGRADIYTPGGLEDGYVPKNIRLALLLTDTAQPYIHDTSSLPSSVEPGETVNFSWQIMGGFTTTETNIQYGTNLDPINNYDYSTTIQSGDTGRPNWQGVEYSESITMPTQPGTYYFVIRAKVDQDTLNQPNPHPDIPPQSLYVNMRTNDSWSISNENNTMQGQTNWHSQIVEIQVLQQEVEYSIDLYEGWNLITVPVGHSWTAETLGENISGCTVVTKFKADTQTYLTHVVGIPYNDFAIENGVGYYVFVNTDLTFVVIGEPIETTSVNLYPGWNMMGWYHDYDTTAESLGQSVDGCTVICMFDASTQMFKTHVVGIPYNNFLIYAGIGIFVYVTESSIWNGG